MKNTFKSILFISLSMCVFVGCSSQPLVNRGDLTPRVECMKDKNIQYEKREDGFYLSDNQWDKFIMFCS